MLFSSTAFIFAFLPVVLLLYYGLCKPLLKNIVARNILLFVASILFYAWGEPVFVLILLLSIVVNWLLGLWAESVRKTKQKPGLMMSVMLIFNISVIFIFKYLMFFMENMNALFKTSFAIPVIALPIGISFFTFQAISYVIDIYRGTQNAQRNVLYVGLYIALFPQLVAGPIIRYSTVAEQIMHRRETLSDFCQGAVRFTWGLSKKVLISNQTALIADAAFNASGDISVGFAWLGAIAYTIQIYFDFSGYSDMALGLGRMFGFKFDENFNYPYISKSVTEFWRRWHISLGAWFREYVYIPLGGSRVSSRGRLILNLSVVWLLTGVWHGASWNFIVWGLYYLVFLILEKLAFPNALKRAENGPPVKRALLHVYALLVTLFGWVLFRAATLPDALSYMGVMLGMSGAPLTDELFLQYIFEKRVYLILGVIFSTPLCPWLNALCKKVRPLAAIRDMLYPVLYAGLFLICVSYLIKNTYNPFIYFNF